MHRKTFVGGGLTVLLLALAGLFTSPAAGAAPTAATTYCFTEVAPVAPGSRELGVVSSTCSNTAQPGTVMPNNAPAAASAQLLVVFYQDRTYGGRYNNVGGNAGPCDGAGYGFSDLTDVEANVMGISSYKLAAGSNCHSASYWTGKNYSGTKHPAFRGDNPFVQPTWDNNLYSMKVRA